MYSLLLYCCSIELAESVWYLYKATGNPLLLEVAKSMITAIDKMGGQELNVDLQQLRAIYCSVH